MGFSSPSWLRPSDSKNLVCRLCGRTIKRSFHNQVNCENIGCQDARRYLTTQTAKWRRSGWRPEKIKEAEARYIADFRLKREKPID